MHANLTIWFFSRSACWPNTTLGRKKRYFVTLLHSIGVIKSEVILLLMNQWQKFQAPEVKDADIPKLYSLFKILHAVAEEVNKPHTTFDHALKLKPGGKSCGSRFDHLSPVLWVIKSANQRGVSSRELSARELSARERAARELSAINF
jgi:hypothetical protein